MKSGPTASRVRATISTGRRMRFSNSRRPRRRCAGWWPRQELVDEIALGAHDLDAVVAGLARLAAQLTKARICRSTPRLESANGVKGEMGDWMRDGATASGW
jgi:hypothetical protein